MKMMRKPMIMLAAGLLAVAGMSCSGETTSSSSPVKLVVTNTQTIHKIDLQNGAEGCDVPIGTVNMRVIPRSPDSSGTFSAVRVTRYRVSYRRTDGGTLVPAPFVSSIDTLIESGASADLATFRILQADALSQAPFASLLPNNGGRDPETGRATVQMDVILEVFGETLGGDNVYDATRFPLDFCYDCGGCD